MAIIALALLLVLGEAIRLVYLYRSVKDYKAQWEAQIQAQPGECDFIYVALGDSVAQGIGASSISKSYVGLIAAHIGQTTGRRVHILNFSVTGATVAGVVHDQLPRLKDINPDFVSLDIGANDVNHNVPTGQFLRDYNTILDALPASKSLVADLPVFGSNAKQKSLDTLNESVIETLKNHNIERAPISQFTRITVNDWTTYAADFFHPSDKGYRNWYNAFEPGVQAIVDPKTM